MKRTKLFSTLVLPAILSALCVSAIEAQPAYNITTIAGTSGTSGFTGDGGAATSADLNFPLGLALSGSTLYVADQVNSLVRMIALGPGTITTFAGTYVASTTTPPTNAGGYAGDGAAANKASVERPTGIGVGASGNIYIADAGNSVVRLVASSGVITTVAGHTSGGAGYSGDNALATGAQFNLPTNVVVDSAGNYYIADSNNNRIRKVGTDGNVNTIAGTGEAEYSGDFGPAFSARINHPLGLAMDSAGNVYFSDSGNHAIRKITLANGGITTVAGNGTAGFTGDGGKATSAQLSHPEAIAFDGGGNLYIADTFNQRIRVVLTDGTIHTIAGNGIAGFSGDKGSALIAQLNFPRGLAVDASGNVYISDNTNHVIRQLAPQAASGNGPAIRASGVISASDFGPASTASVGGWIEIYGSNLSATTRTWNYGDFSGISAPASVDGVSVLVGGQAAYISYVSPTQINALIPSNAATGAQQLIVTTPTGTTAAYGITIRGTQPRLAAPANLNAAGKQYTAAFFLDGTYVLPAVATGRRAAKAGDVIVLYGTGFGSVNPAVNAGQIAAQLGPLSAPFKMSIGGVTANVLYAGITPLILGPVAQTMYNVGLYQFNVQVPAGITPGNFVPVTFTLDGVAGTQTLYTAISN